MFKEMQSYLAFTLFGMVMHPIPTLERFTTPEGFMACFALHNLGLVVRIHCSFAWGSSTVR